jgi:hypothetical protein
MDLDCFYLSISWGRQRHVLKANKIYPIGRHSKSLLVFGNLINSGVVGACKQSKRKVQYEYSSTVRSDC